MTDKFGISLSIGDRVVYTTGGRGHTFLETGVILDIEDKHAYIQSDDSGRKLSNVRGKYELISIAPIIAQHPELFL